MNTSTDTIVAQATAVGTGAIAMIRMSGPRAFDIVRRLLPAEQPGEVIEPRKLYLCRLQTDIPLDQAMLAFFRAPGSYTGEDMVEISCHGGEMVAPRVIEALGRLGARVAQPGEFTRRAVENGKLDLLQAEAIDQLVKAESPAAAENALRQLDGELSGRIRGLRQQLIDLAALLELELDFAEEDVEFAERKDMLAALSDLAERIAALLQSWEKGRGLRHGLRVAIVGKPNVGKSSLLNALLGESRAIVSSTPGTTRAFIDELVQLGNFRFRLIDTAGIRHAGDEIEKAGVERSRARIQDADILLLVVDGSSPSEAADAAIAQECEEALTQEGHKQILLIRNKTDLPQNKEENGRASLSARAEIRLSALTGRGIDHLRAALEKIAREDLANRPGEVCITTVRQKLALERALEYIHQGLQSCAQKLSAEFISRDLRAAGDELGLLIGEISSEQILDEIFAKFCIGK